MFLIVVNRVYVLKMYKTEGELSLTQEESAILLLNHLQNSMGFKRTQQKRSVSHSKNGLCSTEGFKDLARGSIYSTLNRSNTSKILIQKAESQPLFYTLRRESSNGGLARSTMRETGESQMNSIRGTAQSSKMLRSISKNKRLADTLNYNEDTISIFEKYSEPLNNLFSLYAGMGEPLNAGKMKSIKLHKMFKDATLLDSFSNSISCKPEFRRRSRAPSIDSSSRKIQTSNSRVSLTPVDLDLIFVQLTG